MGHILKPEKWDHLDFDYRRLQNLRIYIYIDRLTVPSRNMDKLPTF